MDDVSRDWEQFYRDFRKPGYIDGYEIRQKLGGGSFGVVYKAQKASIEKHYAIKFLRVEESKLRELVLRELETVSLLAEIDHPNLVTIEDKGTVHGIPYIVMGYAGEETLRTRLEEGPLNGDIALDLFVQVCRGVLALHDHSIVHFDLKPANVFLKGKAARVGDYGLSKLVGDAGMTLSMARGTPYYMAPEVSRHQGDHRSDIYSLGVILYECMAGEVPFQGDNEWEVMRAHETQEVVCPPAIRAALKPILNRMLAKDPADRFQRLEDVLRDMGAPVHLGESAQPRCEVVTPAFPQREPHTPDSPPLPAAAPQVEFDSSILNEAFEMLASSNALSRHELVPRAELQDLGRRLRDLLVVRDDLPCVVVCGEFKAGKSTLVNALVRTRVAAVDLLEMTPCSSVIYPSSTRDCRAVEVNGKETMLELAEFLDLCTARNTKERFPGGIDHVHIGVDSDMPFLLVDTPGVGSTTLDNERQQVRALETADLLLWVIDIHALGGLRDFVLVDEARRVGMPIWIVLSQCDTVDDPRDIHEASDWMASEYGLTRDSIFPCAALPAFEAARVGNAEPPGVGIDALREAISGLAERRGEELRRQARCAAEYRIAIDIQRHLETFASEVERHERSLRRVETELQAVGSGVLQSVRNRLLRAVNEEFLAAHEGAIAEQLAAKTSMTGGVSPQAATDAMRRALPADYVDAFWKQQLEGAERLMVDRWHTLMSEAQTRMVQAFTLEKSVLLADMDRFVASGALSGMVDHSLTRRQEDRTQTGLAIAGLATAYSAWVGPAAASVSLGAAVTGVGIPLALLGVGVAWFMKKNEVSKDTPPSGNSEHAARIIRGLRDQFRRGVVEQHLVPRLSEVNSQIIESTLEEWCRSRHGGFDPQALRDAVQRSDDLNLRLRDVLKGVSNETRTR